MDNQRLIIWGFFAVMAYLTWQTWMEEYGSKAQAPIATTEGAALPVDKLDALPELGIEDGELPSVTAATGPVNTAETATEQGSIIVVTTDVLELEINTRGGTIQKATMLEYPVAKDRPDEKVKLLNTEPGDHGAIRSWLRSANGAATDANTLYEASARNFDL
ncbi:MAG: membrane protein insertase YidC, partial [Proteobacteria bacterium]|nr:membrane protein insertase YidC [Pseudomonadota bacterium]